MEWKTIKSRNEPHWPIIHPSFFSMSHVFISLARAVNQCSTWRTEDFHHRHSNWDQSWPMWNHAIDMNSTSTEWCFRLNKAFVHCLSLPLGSVVWKEISPWWRRTSSYPLMIVCLTVHGWCRTNQFDPDEQDSSRRRIVLVDAMQMSDRISEDWPRGRRWRRRTSGTNQPLASVNCVWELEVIAGTMKTSMIIDQHHQHVRSLSENEGGRISAMSVDGREEKENDHFRYYSAAVFARASSSVKNKESCRVSSWAERKRKKTFCLVPVRTHQLIEKKLDVRCSVRSNRAELHRLHTIRLSANRSRMLFEMSWLIHRSKTTKTTRVRLIIQSTIWWYVMDERICLHEWIEQNNDAWLRFE